MVIDWDRFREFLIEARISTCNTEPEIDKNGSKIVRCDRGDFGYERIYDGVTVFIGSEIGFFVDGSKRERIWRANYQENIDKFALNALLSTLQLRGTSLDRILPHFRKPVMPAPLNYPFGDALEYKTKTSGGILGFREEIDFLYGGVPVYTRISHGGEIV